MKKGTIVLTLIVIAICCSFSIRDTSEYSLLYTSSVNKLQTSLVDLLKNISDSAVSTVKGKEDTRHRIEAVRFKMKATDFWLRYFQPVGYMKINGPLPVEWENEVFEKFEKPYKREGAGLSLAELYLNQHLIHADSLRTLIRHAMDAVNIFQADSITSQLKSYHHFFLANRLFLLNLAAIYTTGFECPNKHNIIPELGAMLSDVRSIYDAYNKDFPTTPLPEDYLQLYNKTIVFATSQPADFSVFDHFTFIRDFVNPLFAKNQRLINAYSVRSINFNDYTLNNECYSIFDKSLYLAQNTKGIYSMVEDPKSLDEIRQIGKLLFYDPVLSGNNQRSCASCHKPTQYFTDTTIQSALQFDGRQRLPRNTPSLVNLVFNHLLMLDGKHISLQDQGKDVITNPREMNSRNKDVIEKVMSCDEYKNAFKKFLKWTPEEKKVGLDHIISAITYYYGDFSNYYAPFDDAMNKNEPLTSDAEKGFNLFMGKAQCATCHFIPHFNGVKPPYISSEFEVLGVPDDPSNKKLSADSGRFYINPAGETLHAFRTGTVRNSEFTKPYMHNGVFRTLPEVMDFYNNGGGAGEKLQVDNQTLSSDSLKLTKAEINELLVFIHSLNEKIIFDAPPDKLPVSHDPNLNHRKPGGDY